MWSLFSEWLREEHILEESYAIVGKKSPTEKVDRLLSTRHPSHVNIKGQWFKLSYGTPRRYDHDLLRLQWCKSRDNNYDSLIKAFSEAMPFLMAWEFDYEYNFWQNAHDPIQYESFGRSYEGLPMVTRSTTPPFDKDLVIDTSHNLGRRLLRKGYVEAVGATMYFGDAFWTRTGSKKEEIRALTFLQDECEIGRATRFTFHKKNFTTDQGKEGIVQRILRSTLYPNAQQ